MKIIPVRSHRENFLYSNQYPILMYRLFGNGGAPHIPEGGLTSRKSPKTYCIMSQKVQKSWTFPCGCLLSSEEAANTRARASRNASQWPAESLATTSPTTSNGSVFPWRFVFSFDGFWSFKSCMRFCKKETFSD